MERVAKRTIVSLARSDNPPPATSKITRRPIEILQLEHLRDAHACDGMKQQQQPILVTTDRVNIWKKFTSNVRPSCTYTDISCACIHICACARVWGWNNVTKAERRSVHAARWSIVLEDADNRSRLVTAEWRISGFVCYERDSGTKRSVQAHYRAVLRDVILFVDGAIKSVITGMPRGRLQLLISLAHDLSLSLVLRMNTIIPRLFTTGNCVVFCRECEILQGVFLPAFSSSWPHRSMRRSNLHVI